MLGHVIIIIIIIINSGFAINICRLRERGRISTSVYVRVFHGWGAVERLYASLLDNNNNK